ncbi:hypothetical protein OROMI_020386 [Orobanche minor]
MDARFHNLGVDVNPQSDAFKNLCNSIQIGASGADSVYYADTTLRLDSPGFATSFTSAPKGVKRKWNVVDEPANHLVKPSLNLRLGHSSSSSDSKGSTATAGTSMSKETEEESSMDIELDFTLHLGADKSLASERSASCNLKSPTASPKVDLQLSLFSGPAVSGITAIHSSPTTPKNITNMFTDFGGLSSDVITTPKSSVTCTSGITQSQQHQRSSNCSSKQCQFQGCPKGARGASGLCIAHGGGRRCQRVECNKGAEGRTAFCKAHGGGRRCEFLGCTKSAEGRTDFCIAHGGGRRCSHDDCTKAARGKSGLCIRHGGGKRCQMENCMKSAEGLSGLCISHGGGRRCRYPECNKGAQGSTVFCKAHGGGKRCTYPDCKKGAEGSTPFCKGHGGGKRCSFQGGVCPKSVHGGTLYCVAHGGGKRCAVAECTKSARGRTDFCVRHGGGKRCKSEGCGKSAQGSTDYCKGHGGGKRCMWGHPGCDFGDGDTPCCTFARGKMGLCASHGALVRDRRVHGGATIGGVVRDLEVNEPSSVKPVFSAGDVCLNSVVPCTGSWNDFGHQQKAHVAVGNIDSSSAKVPEGRVHGGNLIAMLTGDRGFGFTSSWDMVGPSEP